jgi:hypothetical protein
LDRPLCWHQWRRLGQQDPFNIVTNRFDHDSISFSGGTVGGTAGAQLQIAHAVLGFETDIDWAGIRGSSNIDSTIFGFEPSRPASTQSQQRIGLTLTGGQFWALTQI